MASGAHLGITGVRTSSGGVAALAGPGLGLRPGSTSLLGPNGAGKPTLLQNLANLLTPMAGAVRVPRWRRSASGRPTPWRDQESPAPVTTAETALERRLSRLLIDGHPSVRRVKRDAMLVEQGTPGSELFLLLEGSLAVEIDGERVSEVGPGAILGELAALEHDVMVVGVIPARVRDRARLLATLCATLGVNPYQVAARLDQWRFGPTVALTAAQLPVEQFRQVQPRLGAVEGFIFIRRPGWGTPAGRRTATLRAVTSCRVAVVPAGVLDRNALAELAEGRRFMPAPAA